MERAAVMKITLLKTYSTYRPGDIVDCDDEVAMRLVMDGTAEAEAVDQVVETAAIAQECESADVTPHRTIRPLKGK
jgi:hypothetical protein